MIITCPHCQTRYQVAFDAIGSAGRKVQCAHCNRAWQQDRAEPEAPEPEDKLFDVMAEEGLDQALAEEAKRAAAEAAAKPAVATEPVEPGPRGTGKVDPALAKKRQRAFNRRQNTMFANLPLGRVRRAARYVGAFGLAGIIGIAYFGRTMIVDQFPSMAGVYASVGLGVNVVGLDFAKVNTLQTLRNGKEVLVVSAEIVGLNRSPAVVPPVIVTLLDTHGEGIYEWSVTPSVRDLMAGEHVVVETQLTLPPGEASRVRLSFTGGASSGASGEGQAPSAAAAHAAPTEHTAEAPAAPQPAAHTGVTH